MCHIFLGSSESGFNLRKKKSQDPVSKVLVGFWFDQWLMWLPLIISFQLEQNAACKEKQNQTLMVIIS